MSPVPSPSLFRFLLFPVTLAIVVGALAWWLGETVSWVTEADRAGILLGFPLACIAAGVGLTGLIYSREIRAWWVRSFARRDPRTGAPLKMADQVEAIVLPVSRAEQPSWIIHHLRPRYVALRYSTESREIAFGIEEAFSDRVEAGELSFFPEVAEAERLGHRLVDVHDLRESKQLTELFVRHFRDALGISRQRIFIDTTGGTKPMSLGAFQAAEEVRVSSIYVRGRAARPGSQDAQFILDPTDRAHGDPRYMSDWTTESVNPDETAPTSGR